MRAQLHVDSGITEGRLYHLIPPDTDLHIGRRRRGEKHIVILEDDHASRDHAHIFWDEHRQSWIVEDNNSTNGTKLNGITIDHPMPLSHRDVIGAGGVRIVFVIEDEMQANPSTAEVKQYKPDPSTHESINPSEITVLDVGELKVLLEFFDNAFHESTHDGVIELALDSIMTVVRPDVVGFLALTKDFSPRMIRPRKAEVNTELSVKLTERMLRERKPVWLAKLEDDVDSESMENYDDAICVPLGLTSYSGDEATPEPFGALHVYRSNKVFEETHYTFCAVLGICLANTLRTLSTQLALEAESSRSSVDSSSVEQEERILGDSKAMQTLIGDIARTAKMSSSVLIRGETGSGKELVARELHQQSARRHRPFVAFKCADLTPSLADAILFGYDKGSFTEVGEDRRGLFRRAEGGTLFLDEIGELNEACQAKLLRVLEVSRIRPVGGDSEVSIDVRVIAATNRDLEEDANVPFRRDLAYRLGVTLTVPPLRARAEDVPILARHFLQHFNREYRRSVVGISVAAINKMKAYPWPGNVRELRVVIERAVLTCETNAISSEELCLPEPKPSPSSDDIKKEMEREAAVAFHEEMLPAELEKALRLETVERRAIEQALKYTGGNKTRASDLLGICRDTLLRKLKKYEETK